ncbi:hypothetical protein [Nocardia bhagyanarayanae]|uniref:Uncharacterized protein n=1 Tax=Nocardia bhagyanarayanae TaxID=1215925 RepID=A0A543FEZ7_9NOCA|nr:hypothetical protein [Nocardia bhagyanarayanae]TQM32435.1 hypothetical protein FB390_4114 [Nocardia bhagyanarayanae]
MTTNTLSPTDTGTSTDPLGRYRYALALPTGLALIAALGAPPIVLLLLTATLGCAILASVLRESRAAAIQGGRDQPPDRRAPGA